MKYVADISFANLVTNRTINVLRFEGVLIQTSEIQEESLSIVSLSNNKNLQKKNARYKITTHKLIYIVYWKERRGECLDKLILCLLKLRIIKDLKFLIKKGKEKVMK